MLAERMLPFIWLRLVVLIGFTIFVAVKSMWVVTLIAVALTVWTVFQLAYTYRNLSQ
ncbi:hypothetical protein I6I68_06910 [Corynebacterium glucuronolyticum]|uniref:hypothetical protein n=1 Tax=Corynebacterium glucuronolyticum TaxID=39791 RepID=UPI00191F30E6|nr:hypothetical protein [Corynebacterium glucuronolyticum]QQU87403.1 hypothetical protein I6I68_06910 [Corynebacterium glucuronolyticum]